MEKEDKIKMFQSEINLINNPNTKKEVTHLIGLIPDYFFQIPASSTGKYHPNFALGDGGLVRHTKACVKIANELLQLEMFTKISIYKDYIISSLILHDSFKNGNNEKYTRSDHPLLAKNFINGNCKDEAFKSIVCDLIKSHMGQWNTDFKTGKEILPKPVTPLQKFVHLCDYLASRKFLEIKFE